MAGLAAIARDWDSLARGKRFVLRIGFAPKRFDYPRPIPVKRFLFGGCELPKRFGLIGQKAALRSQLLDFGATEGKRFL